MFYIVSEDVTAPYYNGVYINTDSIVSILDSEDCVIETYTGEELDRIQDVVDISNYFRSQSYVSGRLGLCYFARIESVYYDRLTLDKESLMCLDGFPLLSCEQRAKEPFVISSCRKPDCDIVMPVKSGLNFVSFWFSWAQVLSEKLYFSIFAEFRSSYGSVAKACVAFVMEDDGDLSLFSISCDYGCFETKGLRISDGFKFKDRSFLAKLMLTKNKNNDDDDYYMYLAGRQGG